MASSAPFLPASLICLLVGLAVQKASGACSSGAANVNAFWVPIEGREDMSSTGVPILLTGPKTKSLLDSNGTVIALVSELTFQKCKEEGSCYLQQRDSLGSSVLVSYAGGDNVFRRLNTVEFPFGAGAWNKVLELFVSVATSDFAPGTRLYIKELDGLDLKRPREDRYRSQVHNGCVRVDDVGAGDCKLGFFTGFFRYYKALRTSLPSVVHPRAVGDCSILQYM